MSWNVQYKQLVWGIAIISNWSVVELEFFDQFARMSAWMYVCMSEWMYLMCYLMLITDNLALICSELASTEACTYIFAYSS